MKVHRIIISGLSLIGLAGCGGGGGGSSAPQPVPVLAPTGSVVSVNNQNFGSTPVFQLSGSLQVPYSKLNSNPSFSDQLNQMNNNLNLTLEPMDFVLSSGQVLTMQDLLGNQDPLSLLRHSCIFRTQSCDGDSSCSPGSNGQNGEGGGSSYQDVTFSMNSQIEAYPVYAGTPPNTFVPTTIVIQYAGVFAAQTQIQFFNCFTQQGYSPGSPVTQSSVPPVGSSLATNFGSLITITPISLPNYNNGYSNGYNNGTTTTGIGNGTGYYPGNVNGTGTNVGGVNNGIGPFNQNTGGFGPTSNSNGAGIIGGSSTSFRH